MATNAQTVRYGSKGSSVSQLQKLLNQNGYNLKEDGNFGPNTLSAVKDYQKKSKLSVDGIVGNNTWTSLTSGNSSTKSGNSTSSASKGFSYDDFSYDDYTESDTVSQAQAALNAQIAAKPGEYQSAWKDQINDIIDRILNREEFSYDVNSDALYQQYKDLYMQQGSMAAQDVMGQAAAMTGGYGNSYASTVGNQQYQQYLSQLNEVVPELYQTALDQYNQEGDNLYQQYALLGDQESQDYSRYQDTYNQWLSERDYLAGRYDSERSYDYGKYSDDRDFAYGTYADDKSYAYDEYRNAIADEQWQTEYDESVRQYNEQMAFQKEQYADSKKATESTTKSYSGKTSSGSSYNNGSLTDAQVKELQAALGVDADGYYGSETKEAAGGLSAAEAYKKYVGSSSSSNTSGTSKTSTVSDSIKNKASNYSSNNDLANYLDGLAASGVISEEEADALYAENMTPDEVKFSERNWKLKDGGGINWFGGVDNNATVTDQYGHTYTMAKLVDALTAEGMSKSEAKEYVKNLQKRLGA